MAHPLAETACGNLSELVDTLTGLIALYAKGTDERKFLVIQRKKAEWVREAIVRMDADYGDQLAHQNHFVRQYAPYLDDEREAA